MLVRDMSQPPIVVSPKAPISDALKMMRERGIRRLPVVDPAGRIVGIVSDKDLLHAEPSAATSLSIWRRTTVPPPLPRRWMSLRCRSRAGTE